MEIIIGIIVYLAVLGLFSAFGKFLKECDEQVKAFTSQSNTGEGRAE
jgi:hypothetical protein